MDFGKVSVQELDGIDFRLQPDPAFNKAVLTGEKVSKPLIYVGCAKWGRTEWVGKIYPPKTKEKDFLQHYANHYNSIELNATHYKLYDEVTIIKWADKVGKKDFLFCPKMYQGVTHEGSLVGKELLTAEFLCGVMSFKEKLGPVFIQVSEVFSPQRKSELIDYLKSLPANLQFFMELRHSSWFKDISVTEDIFGTMRNMNIGAVITDASGRRDCAHMYLPVAKAFIRYVGNSLHATDYTRIDGWVDRIKYWVDNGLKELYFFMHMHDEATSPELTAYLVDKLNATLKLNLIKPTFVPRPNTLF